MRRWIFTWSWPEVIALGLGLAALAGLWVQYGFPATLWVFPAVMAGAITASLKEPS